jgi:phosphoglycerate kinase
MNFKTLNDFDVKGKRVLLRADLNVPRDGLRVTDTSRIDRLKETVITLHQRGAQVLILSHFGRPEGEQNPQMSLAFLLPVLEECWGVPVAFCRDCVGDSAEAFSRSLENGQIALMENVRFHKGEEANDPAFIAKLAALGDLYVNDAFSAAHRAHASTEGLAHVLPTAAGLLMEEELRALDKALGSPQAPVAAIVGGSKVSTKLDVLYNLIEKVDYLVLGGGMANTFLFADGADIGGSLCEKNMADQARQIMAKAKARGCRILLPRDSVVVKSLGVNAPHEHVDSYAIPAEKMAVDIGALSSEHILETIKDCKTIVWNGPMGVFEIPPFDRGTNAIAKAVAARSVSGHYVSIAGGGDTVAALDNAGVIADFTYISGAGGAFLEWLEGKELPGVTALTAFNALNENS